MKKENKTPLSLNIWKWWNIVYLSAFTLIIAWASIFHRDAVIRALARYDPLWITLLQVIVDIVLSLLIIYGIIKRHKIGYFASLLYLLMVAIRAKIYNIEVSSSGLIVLILIIVVAFFIFKNGEYFGIRITDKKK